MLVPYNQLQGGLAPLSQREQAENLVDQAARGTLTQDILKSIGLALIATFTTGAAATLSGTDRVMNGVGAGVSVAASAVIIGQLQKQRRWEILGLLEKIHQADLKETVVEVLAQRAMLATGETLALPPSGLSAFDQPESVVSFEQPEPQCEPIAAYQPPSVPSPSRSSYSSPVANPVFTGVAAPVTRKNQNEFEFDDIAKFRCLVWVKGAKGSGKTSKVTHLEKLRHDFGHKVWRIDPMPSANDIHRRRGIALYGANDNWAEIEFAVQSFNQLAEQRLLRRGKDPNYSPEDDQHVNLSMDEGSVLCNINPEVLSEFWLHTVVRRIRQANMSVTIGTHGETKRFLGMTADPAFTGLIDSLKEDAVMVQSHTLDSVRPQPYADIIYQGRTWRVNCSHILPHEKVEFLPHDQPSDDPVMTDIEDQEVTPVRTISQPRVSPILALALASPSPQQPLPEVRRYTHHSLPGVSIVEPELLEILAERPAFSVIVKKAIGQGGRVTSRDIQQMSHHNSALKNPEGTPLNAKQIQCLMQWLATNYPSSFSYEEKGAVLQILDPALFEVQI